jgi:hypothetical protein
MPFSAFVAAWLPSSVEEADVAAATAAPPSGGGSADDRNSVEIHPFVRSRRRSQATLGRPGPSTRHRTEGKRSTAGAFFGRAQK